MPDLPPSDPGEVVRVEVPPGAFGAVFFWFAVSVAVFHLLANGLGTAIGDTIRFVAALTGPAEGPLRALARWFSGLSTLSTLTLCGLHFAGFVILCAMRFPIAHVRHPRLGPVVRAADLAFALLVAMATVFLVASEGAIYDRGVRLTALEWAAAALVIVAAAEYARRTTGIVIPLLILIALTYPTVWGDDIAGVFRFAGLTAETVAFRSIFSDEGMFGFIGRISATFVVMFILFGAFLLRSGAGAFIIDLARALAGRVTGGPGFVAVFASGLTGTISGSAISNTVSTGVITIPLMIRSGFPPRFAAGVEAAASTGGQLMPPIMGAGAFVMANYTQIPYLDIIAAAALPALVYFLSVALFVRIEARRSDVTLAEESPPIGKILREGGPAFLIPVGVLVGMMVSGFTPTFSAGFAILSVIAASWLTPRPMGPRAIVEALALGAVNMITTAILLIAVGLVVNVILMTGVGNTISLMIADWSSGNLFIALVLIAVASLVLGMGLPVTAAYIVLATLSAPALQTLIMDQSMGPAEIDAMLIGQIADGTLAETLKPFFLLADPAALTALAGPMPFDQAEALYRALPPEVLGEVYRTVRAGFDPAFVTGALLAAHMIIFWLSQDSNVTPPVCLTAFAAAAIAKTKPMATGMMAWKLSKGLYLVPIFFAYTPFLTGDPATVFVIFLQALLAMAALGIALEGFFERPVGWITRGALAVAGIVLVWPLGATVNLVAAGIVVALLVLILATGRRGDRDRGRPAAA